MRISPERVQLSQKRDPYERVYFSTTASCLELHNAVESEAKLNSFVRVSYDAIWWQ